MDIALGKTQQADRQKKERSRYGNDAIRGSQYIYQPITSPVTESEEET